MARKFGLTSINKKTGDTQATALKNIKLQHFILCFGAQERTRTSTSIRTLAPEASASTNSATWAGVVEGRLSLLAEGVNRIREVF